MCHQHDARRSATTQPTSSGDDRAASDYSLPPKESSPWNGSVELDIEALVREVYEIVKAQIEAEEGFIMESSTRGSEDEEEEASLHMEDGSYVQVGRAYGGDTREGAEQATLLSCGEWTTVDEVVDYGGGVATDNGVRKEVSTDTTSDGSTTLHNRF